MYYTLFCYFYFCYCLYYLFCFGTGKNYWAKDLIFLVTTREEYGMQAWLELYMGQPSSLGEHTNTHTHTQTHTHTLTHTHSRSPPPEYLSSFRPLVLLTAQTDRQTDRQTERQTDRQTDRQRDRQTDRLLSLHIYTHTLL